MGGRIARPQALIIHALGDSRRRCIVSLGGQGGGVGSRARNASLRGRDPWAVVAAGWLGLDDTERWQRAESWGMGGGGRCEAAKHAEEFTGGESGDKHAGCWWCEAHWWQVPWRCRRSSIKDRGGAGATAPEDAPGREGYRDPSASSAGCARLGGWTRSSVLPAMAAGVQENSAPSAGSSAPRARRQRGGRLRARPSSREAFSGPASQPSFVAHCSLGMQTRWSARLFTSRHLRPSAEPSLFPLPKSLPHNYCATTHSPPTQASYQTLSTPQTHAIASRPGAAAAPTPGALNRSEPPRAHPDCSVASVVPLGALCPSLNSEGCGRRRWEIVS